MNIDDSAAPLFLGYVMEAAVQDACNKEKKFIGLAISSTTPESRMMSEIEIELMLGDHSTKIFRYVNTKPAAPEIWRDFIKTHRAFFKEKNIFFHPDPQS